MSIPEEKAKTRTSRSLTATLAIAFLTLSVVVLLVASSIEVYLNFRAEQEIISSQQQLIAQEAANTVASFIQEKFSVLEAAVKLGSPTASSPEEQQRVLDNLLGLQPPFRHLVLLDTQEQELARASRLSQAVWENFIGRIESDVFDQVELGQRYISPVQVDEVTSEPLVIMAVPATDIFGDFRGTLIAEVNLKFMWDLVDQLEIGETGQAYVVNRQGDLLAFGDIARVLRRENVSHLNEVAEFTSSSMSVDETGAGISQGIEGTTVVGTYVPLGTPDWAVVTELPVREAYQPVVQGVALSLGVILAMATLAGIMGVYVARRLAVPLLDLTETATRIADGELSLEATAKGPRETIRLADAFNSMTTQLRELIDSLEERVAARTRDLALAVEVGRNVSQVRDLGTLLTEAVETIRDRFDLYYAQVYLADAEERTLTLRAGTGTAGKELLRRGHHLPIGPGSINGVAAVKKQAVIVEDTATSSIFRANSLLPDTRSEMAVPLVAGERVVGVIDLQSSQPNALTEENLPAFEALAGQLAIAIQNANLFTEAAQARSEMEAQIRGLAREGWQQFLDGINRSEHFGYSYDLGSIKPLDEPLTMTGKGNGTLTTDIAVTGEPVGAIQLEAEQDKIWTPDEAALVESVAQQVGQQIENLRLLVEAERYRVEAEEATRRLVREGWQSYQQEVPMAPGYVYDQNEVAPLQDEANGDDPDTLKQGLAVRGETIGYLEVAETNGVDGETTELLTAVAERLSAHIENLRLTEQTERALAGTEALYQGSERVVRANTVDDVLQALIETTALQQFNGVSILLYDEPTRTETIPASATVVAARERSGKTPILLSPGSHHVTAEFPLARFFNRHGPTIMKDIATDERIDERMQALFRSLGTQGLAVFPLVVGDLWIGIVTADSDTTLEINDEQIRQIDSLVDQAAAVIQSKRLFEQVQEALLEAQALYDFSGQLNAATDLDDIVQAVTSPEISAEAENVALVLLDLDETGQPEWATFAASWQSDEAVTSDPLGTRFYLPELPIAKLWISNPHAPLLIEDIESDERLDPQTRQIYQQTGTRASVIMPLSLGGQWLGLIVLTWMEPQQFTERDERLYKSVATQTAIALSNQQLLEQTQQTARRERMLRQITARVRGSADVESIMQTAVQEVGQALGRKAFIYLGNGNQEQSETSVEEKET